MAAHVVVTMTVDLDLDTNRTTMMLEVEGTPGLSDHLADGALVASWLREAATLARQEGAVRMAEQRQGGVDRPC